MTFIKSRPRAFKNELYLFLQTFSKMSSPNLSEIVQKVIMDSSYDSIAWELISTR